MHDVRTHLTKNFSSGFLFERACTASVTIAADLLSRSAVVSHHQPSPHAESERLKRAAAAKPKVAAKGKCLSPRDARRLTSRSRSSPRRRGRDGKPAPESR